MPVPVVIGDLSTVAASNFPAGSDSPANLDDVQRAQASFIAQLRDGKGFSSPVTLASAATTDIGGQNSAFVEISGTTGITSFGANYNGPRFLRFTGALLLTHNATTLNLPGAANITTVAGDTAIAYPNQALSGWNVVQYQRAAALPATAGANSDITSLSGVTSINGANVAFVPVRQTVLSGPVDSSGFAAFGGATGGTTVTAAGTLIATAANGFVAAGQVNYIGSIVNPSWTGLSVNGTMYLYLDIAANGVCTPGSTTLAPVYQWGGAYSTTNGQFTFNIQEMVGKVGNGATAAQTYRVFVGEVTVAGGVVTAIVWYALQGKYRGTSTSTPSATRISKSHNIGTLPQKYRVALLCVSANNNYSLGDEYDVTGLTTASNAVIVGTAADRLTVGVISNTGGLYQFDKSGGVTGVITLASWNTVFYADRGW